MRTVSAILGVCCLALAAGNTPDAVVFRGDPGPGPALSADWRQDGRATVTVEPGAGGRSVVHVSVGPAGATTLTSPPLALRTGHLYRLSADIRTRGVAADPGARYPVALGACLSMASMPFTNASPTVAGDGREHVSMLFFATASEDRVRLHLGRNGNAQGEAWFGSVQVEAVDDITAYVPLETVRWAGKGFRFDEGGWIHVHLEGAPYERGRQYGELLAQEIPRYLDKLAILQDKGDPARGWAHLRTLTDALMLRKYDPELLEEMKGIADGVGRAGAKWRDRALDLLDVATLNSAVDLGQLDGADRVTPTPLTGRRFMTAEDEAAAAGKGDHCSSFVATGSATAHGGVVMTQMFMWNGYTGVHWDVMVDVQPEKGHRFVMQTFPGGIHSGSDWYVNDAGIVIGETTVGQTPFDAEGTPQSDRARRAAQYAASIDDVARILSTRNNGLYTNDWTLADVKTGEGACFLLGTHASRMWRTGDASHKADTPGNLKDFIWAVNNNRDLGVRREYVANADNAPVDLAFNTWNRDIAMVGYQARYGQGLIDLDNATRFLATSPVNRPHACDAKITTTEMARELMFMAHYGKTTHREKWPGGRWIADLPGAVPHLTLGYTTFSPVFVAERLKAAHAAERPAPAPAPEAAPEVPAVKDLLSFEPRLLWSNTVVPAADEANWFASGSAAYHALLSHLPADPAKAREPLADGLREMAARLGVLALREPPLAPRRAVTDYTRYGAYQIPRLRGVFALHQLRLALGNRAFSKVMNAVQDRWRDRAMGTDDFLATASAAAGRDLGPLVRPWIEREDLPDPAFTAEARKVKDGWEVTCRVTQKGEPWPFAATVELRTAKGARLERVEVRGREAAFTFPCKDKPLKATFDATGDLPVPLDNPWSFAGLLEDFDTLLYVKGTSRQPESSNTLALAYRDLVADQFAEVLPPLRADAEVTPGDLAQRSLVLLGGAEDNALVARLAREGRLPVTFGRNFFRWQGKTYGRADDGLALALPSPWAQGRTIYLLAANSRLQLWHMTRTFTRGLPTWALYRGGDVTAKGWAAPARFEVALGEATAR